MASRMASPTGPAVPMSGTWRGTRGDKAVPPPGQVSNAVKIPRLSETKGSKGPMPPAPSPACEQAVVPRFPPQPWKWYSGQGGVSLATDTWLPLHLEGSISLVGWKRSLLTLGMALLGCPAWGTLGGTAFLSVKRQRTHKLMASVGPNTNENTRQGSLQTHVQRVSLALMDGIHLLPLNTGLRQCCRVIQFHAIQ